ncbi:PEP-CTERM sorting domain-containing protein [Actomonas aquatica]|uniref:PEP-CTERM sorting domain-containing protein n=1 Tax=Actomonas aquatica TaxID=2866162 RepID=A0ABZ1CC36_9BACT|nr:PEP-CTERM sorting domain-containing protein [Opitutus sp. WL0086]WRQ89232.1 PEP-CTERM sorting domain-containing protein [Opitutus sp. WL0086]
MATDALSVRIERIINPLMLVYRSATWLLVSLFAGLAWTSGLRARAITYTFDTDLEGWSNVLTSTTGPLAFGYQPVSDLLRLESPGISVSDGNSPHRDWAQSSALLIRSPEFQVNSLPEFSITFELGSGSGTTDGAPSTDADAALSQPSSVDGYTGLLLRNASTGAYLIASTMTDTSTHEQTVMWTSGQLQSLVNTSDYYTLDLVDMDQGAWGWVSLDNVSIYGASAVPEPATTALWLGLVGLVAVAAVKRRRD